MTQPNNKRTRQVMQHVKHFRRIIRVRHYRNKFRKPKRLEAHVIRYHQIMRKRRKAHKKYLRLKKHRPEVLQLRRLRASRRRRNAQVQMQMLLLSNALSTPS